MPFHDIIGHDRPKAILQAAIRHDRIAHAYLFHGEEAIGKRLTALRFIQALTCEAPPGSLPHPHNPDACGACRGCLQIEAHTHPDFLEIQPDQEQANPQIKIEQVREIEHQLVYRPLVASRKICLINDADRMTLSAANALLKTLEEPPDHSLLLLVSSLPLALLATIRSRCQALRFVPPPEQDVEIALRERRRVSSAEARFLTQVSQARIGQALTIDLAEARAHEEAFSRLASPPSLQSVASLLNAAEALHKADRSTLALEWIGRWVRDVILVKVGTPHDQVLYGARRRELEQAAAQADLRRLLELLEHLDQAQRAGVRNLNPQLTLETVLLQLRDAYRGTGKIQPA